MPRTENCLRAEDKLWREFREIHGPRPGGRGFQKAWEKKWEQFKKEHGHA